MELGDRMKSYEEVYRYKLPIRTPVIIRLDGVAFHTKTRNCVKPYDSQLKQEFVDAVTDLMEEIPARFAYHQSDEVSLLLIDYNKFDSQQWYGGIIQKMASISASILSARFNYDAVDGGPFKDGGTSYFDSRVFSLPKEEVINYFIWRQRDCRRNAISGAAQAKFSQSKLNGVNQAEMITMLMSEGIYFESDYPPEFRNGTFFLRGYNQPAPIFSDNRGFLEQYLKVEEE